MRALIALLVLAAPAAAAPAPARMHLNYDVYAAGLRIATFDVSYGLGDGGYSVAVGYGAAGLLGTLYRGHQTSMSQGVWTDSGVAPLRASSDGVWHGEPHRLAIDYKDGGPVVRELTPPDDGKREPVPGAMQAHTIDALSAMILLVRKMAETGRCDSDATTFDGRRLVRVASRTVGPETLDPTGRSAFAGPATRCDLEGVLVAGALKDDDPAQARRPKHGSAWFAPTEPGGPPVPVRLSFETRWVGDVTMYLTKAAASQPDGARAADVSGNPK